MIVAPDGRKIYTLPDLLFWILDNHDSAIQFIKSDKFLEWLKSQGYNEIVEEIKYTENIEDIINLIKKNIFTTNKEIVISKASAIERVLKSVK